MSFNYLLLCCVVGIGEVDVVDRGVSFGRVLRPEFNDRSPDIFVEKFDLDGAVVAGLANERTDEPLVSKVGHIGDRFAQQVEKVT